MRIPMPSPNGTNYAKLFIDAPGMAFDAKPKYARDQAPRNLVRSLARVIDDLRPKGVAADNMVVGDHPLTTDIENLRNLLFSQLPHPVFVEVDTTLTKMAADVRDILQQLHTAANADVIAAGDQPPNFAGRPERGQATDSITNLRVRLRETDRANTAARRSLRGHLAKIGAV